uniref:hypothetical protein n=1 Tax=Flavobacterium sp. TaxID=239 RepID=UPI00404A7BED
MGFFNKEVELIIPPKKQNTNNKTIKAKSLNGYDAIREKIDEGRDTVSTVKTPVLGKGPQQEKPKTKVSIGL